MALTLSERIQVLSECYNVTELSSIDIDGNEISGYFTYTFVNAKTLKKQPKRSQNGQIKNLNSYAWFLTPRLKIFFNYLSLDAYQTIMRLIQSKNEFRVTFFDIEKGKTVTHNMYFSTEDYPELIFGYGKLRGIKGYTIELQGTNTSLGNLQIKYNLNAPVSGYDNVFAYSTNFTSGTPMKIGDGAKDLSNVKFQDYTFGGTYKFVKWSTVDDGSGFNYIDGQEYAITQDDTTNNVIELYAQWQAGG